MKIAHIAPPWISIPPQNYGGTEAVIAYLIEEQVLLGHDVTLFTPGDAQTPARQISFFSKSLLEQGVPWQAHLKAFYHYYEAIELVKTLDFDILHAHLSSPADMYLFPLMSSLSVPRIITQHSPFPFDKTESWIGDADQLYMKWISPTPIVAVSRSAYANMPSDLNCVGVVHVGVPLKRFCPTGEKREDFFTWLGRFFPEKGPHLAIEAARRVNVPIVLAGTVDTHDQRSVHYFRDMIEPLIDDDKVKYIGPVNMKQKIDLLSRAYAFLNPIEWEELGGAVMIEAMALGCPVISFARGVADECIIHGKTGFLAQNLDEMVHFMSCIDDIDREATRGHVQDNFSAQTMNERYIDIYKKVISMDRSIFIQPRSAQKQNLPLRHIDN